MIAFVILQMKFLEDNTVSLTVLKEEINIEGNNKLIFEVWSVLEFKLLIT